MESIKATWDRLLSRYPRGTESIRSERNDLPTTPNLRPDYEHPVYSRSQTDPAKRQLDFQRERPQASLEAQTYARQYGTPYRIRTDPLAPPDEKGKIKYLAAETVGPFMAAAIADNDLPLAFSSPPGRASREMGVANREPPQERPRPYIPLIHAVEQNLKNLQEAGQVHRVPWHTRNFLATEETENQFLKPTRVPKACWQQMQEDAFSWCKPDKIPPVGVEGSEGKTKAFTKPHKIYPWNEKRDSEMYEFEALARDGIRMANANAIALGHLMNGVMAPEHVMDNAAKRHTCFTLNDFAYTLIDQFARLAHKIALQRKRNVVESLNMTDTDTVMRSKITADMFDGQWPTFQAEETARRKVRKEKEKEDEEKQKRKRAADAQQRKPFRGRQDQPREDNRPREPPRPPKAAPRRQSPKRDKKDKKQWKKDGGNKRGGGGGNRRR